MKRILCYILGFIIISCNIVVFAAASPKVSLVLNDTVSSEETFDVYVAVTENSDICSGRITIGYDSAVLEIIDIAGEELLNGASVVEKLDFTESAARVSWLSLTNITSGGNLLKLTFKAKTIYEDVNASIYVQEMKFTDFEENKISCTAETLSVPIKAKELPTLSVECPEETLIGSTIDVKINISKNSRAFGGRFDLVYDNTRLEFVSDEVGAVFGNSVPFTNSGIAENKIRLNWAGTSEMLEGGTMLTVRFKVLEVQGEAMFSFENYRMRGDNDIPLEIAVIENSVNVVQELICSTETEFIEENGQWKFIGKIKNCPEEAIIIVALYDGNQMVEVGRADVSDDSKKYEYLPENTFDEVKIFVWKSYEALIPISVPECQKKSCGKTHSSFL